MATIMDCSRTHTVLDLFSWFLRWTLFGFILVPIFAASYIFWCIAHLRNIVVNLARWASKRSLIDSIQAHIEFLAIGWMWIFWMGNNLSLFIGRFNACGWAVEFITITRQFCKFCKIYIRMSASVLDEMNLEKSLVYLLLICSLHVELNRARHMCQCIHRNANRRYIRFHWHHHRYNCRMYCTQLDQDGQRTRSFVDTFHLFPLVVLNIVETKEKK